MKYLCGIKGQTQIKCEANGKEPKAYKCTAEVKAKAKAELKRGDLISCEFDPTTYVMVKISKYIAKSKGKGNYSPKNYEAINKQSAVKSASRAICGVDGVTTKNYKTIYEALIEIGYSYIAAGAKDTKDVVADEEEEEPEKNLEEEEED